MIKISLNKELDYEVYVDFRNFSVAGADFGEKIKKNHPNINIEDYKKYIDNFYISNKLKIQEKQEQINKLLSDKQNKFFTELEEIFKIDFTKDTYQGYLSIFNCNPRYPETKTFQIYYNKDLSDMLEVALHESLHFAFFDYFDKTFPEYAKKLNKNSGILWELSEILNVIILNLPPFRKIMGREELLFYPELQTKLNLAKKMWSNTGDISKFITEYLKTNQ